MDPIRCRDVATGTRQRRGRTLHPRGAFLLGILNPTQARHSGRRRRRKWGACYQSDRPLHSIAAPRCRARFCSRSRPSDAIRRLKIDLHGLPPTPEEVDAFVADTSEHAYENLVDRLLESPQFGVRWARHWLDVAGYSETDGNPTKDTERQHAWRYRDYVIESINRDKPYDQFLLEQLAGDECIEGDPDSENERHVELMTATGFLRMAPDITATNNGLHDRNQAVADMIKVVGSSVLGLSVGCAQCHDHRYDAITIEDYYRYRAIFDPAFPLTAWQQPDQRLIDLTPAV
ncbi:MAG: DUF1549 domain-containing protein, partial [Planctomycetes bacterium]|nr:DUF1549 domain-containing protein [Planctomycetota bacterium]